MVFALGAGKLLNLDNGGEFEETIIGEFEKVRPGLSIGMFSHRV